jgi:hypothetical protein
MAKARKARKAARRPAAKRRAKTAKLPARRVAKPRRSKRGSKSRSVTNRMIDTIRETGTLRDRMAGRNTFED